MEAYWIKEVKNDKTSILDVFIVQFIFLLWPPSGLCLFAYVVAWVLSAMYACFCSVA
jgi:hypothetical protein